MTGGPGLAARATGRGRRCWAERAEGESWAAVLGPVRERVGRAGRGKEGVGRLALDRAGGLGRVLGKGGEQVGLVFGVGLDLVFLFL